MSNRSPGIFKEQGLGTATSTLVAEIQSLYLEDQVPWIVGYSGGKDSTAVLQLVWTALASLPKHKRNKPVHIISTDTLVENPIVALWVSRSLEQIRSAANEQGLPFQPHRLTPEVKNSFWVNLIGRGYPSPRNRFRWCTDRLKIQPSNKFIIEVVRTNGEAILLLGTRKAESSKRAAVMNNLETHRLRQRISPNARLPNCLVYSPIEDWSSDDVWTYLMQVRNPWGYDNKTLLGMYQGASPDGECPLVVDESTPSCGDSRFGCWVCTMVDQDKSMTAMIQNDGEKEWMLPLLALRNDLDARGEEEAPLRDFRRITGNVDVRMKNDGEVQHIRGPYTQMARESWLRRVLEAQGYVRETGPDEVRDIELITIPEMDEIRRIWITEKHEIEDRLPIVYEEIVGEKYPIRHFETIVPFGTEEMAVLADVCGDNRMQYEMIRELINVEQNYRNMTRRSGRLFDDLEKAVARNFYEDEEDAVTFERSNREILFELRKKHDLLNSVVSEGSGQLYLPILSDTSISQNY